MGLALILSHQRHIARRKALKQLPENEGFINHMVNKQYIRIIFRNVNAHRR